MLSAWRSVSARSSASAAGTGARSAPKSIVRRSTSARSAATSAGHRARSSPRRPGVSSANARWTCAAVCAWFRAGARLGAVSSTEERIQLWGGETAKAVENFPVSGEPIPVPVARWLGRIKAAAARANAELDLLDADKAERIAAAGDRIAAGELDDQFPIDVFQTGSGTSSNMNANEVMASLAGDDVHVERRRQHGPVLERRLPVRRPPRRARRADERPPAGAAAARRLARGEGGGVRRRRQVGPHPLDGRCPGHARPGVRRLRGAGAPGDRARRVDARAGRPDPARRHRCRHRAEHAPGVRGARAGQALRRDRPHDPAARRPLRGPGGAGRARRGVRGAEDRRRLADEDRQRPPLHGLRPARRARGDLPPGAPEGQLDHARQGQPGDPRGRHPGRGAGDRERRRRSRSAACRATSS